MKNKKTREIPNTNEINNFLHCALCISELPADESLQSYTRYEVGYTEIGLQIWCKRHNCNIIHLDFAGQKFYANTSRELIQGPKTIH